MLQCEKYNNRGKHIQCHENRMPPKAFSEIYTVTVVRMLHHISFH